MKRFLTLPSISNVAAGATFTLNMPVGPTYHRVSLSHNLADLDDLQDLEVIINGKTVQKYLNGSQVEAINEFYGRALGTGILSLYFGRPELVELEQQRILALGTADVQTLTIKGKIAAGATYTGGDTAPSIEADAWVSAPEPLGLLVKVRQFPYSSSVAGQVDVDNLPRGPRIAAIHFGKADVNAVEVNMDSRIIVEGTKAKLEQWQKEQGRTPITAGFTHVDFCLEGDLSGALATRTAQDLRFKLDLGAPGLVNMAVEYIDGWDGI